MNSSEHHRLGRAGRLKAATATLHETLDARIMDLRPFSDRGRYARFLLVQHAFSRDLEPLHRDPSVLAMIPDVRGRSRLGKVEADLRDLAVVAEDAGAPGPALTDPAEGLGWLYVAEGSKLGAAFLLKQASRLGLDADFGARHLAPHPQGRAGDWRRFVACLDAAPLSRDEEGRAEHGARAAFGRFADLLDAMFSAYPSPGGPASGLISSSGM